MTQCERCGQTAASTWNVHVRQSEVTQRQSEEVCLDCHPYLAVEAGVIRGGRVAD